MPGVKGAGGPPPKRESQRRRANKPEVPVEVRPSGEPVVLEPDEGWHPIARMMWDALGRSGQAVFYTDSDWAAAFAMCESMSREFEPQFVGLDKEGQPVSVKLPPKAASQQAWSKTLTGLMALEGDRRRLRLELVRQGVQEEAEDGPSHLDEYRRRLTG